jgi:hypothetical protein
MLPNIFQKNKDKDKAKKSDDVLFMDITPKTIKTIYTTPGESRLIVKGVSVFEDKPGYEGNILQDGIEEAFTQADARTENAIVGVSGSSVFGFLLILEVRRDNAQTRITNSEMTKIYDKIEAFALKQAHSYRDAIFAEEYDLVNLDLVITKNLLDGQEHPDLIDRQGEYIQVHVFASYAEAGFHASLKGELSQLKINPLAITTTIYTQVKLLSSQSKNFILIDVGKSYTDVAIIFGGDIIQTRSFGIAGDYFSQHLTDQLGILPKEANGKKEAFSEGTLSQSDIDTIGDYLYEAGKDWRLSLVAVLESISGIKALPKKIYLSGGSGDLGVLEELLYEEDWKSSLPFAGEIEIEKADRSLLDKYLIDDLKILKELRMFAPASLSIVYKEITKDDEEEVSN